MTSPNEFGQTDALVGVIMGSRNDWETMKAASDVLAELDIPHEKRVVSAHRTPARMIAYAQSAEQRGLRVIIAGAGGAAHLPGMVASETNLPVVGVPVQSRTSRSRFATFDCSDARRYSGSNDVDWLVGCKECRTLRSTDPRGTSDPSLKTRLNQFIEQQTQTVLDSAEL